MTDMLSTFDPKRETTLEWPGHELGERVVNLYTDTKYNN